MSLIVLGGLLLGVLLSRTLARPLGWSGGGLLLATLGLGSIGLGGGVLIVTAIFGEDFWARRPQVMLNLSPFFVQDRVVLLSWNRGLHSIAADVMVRR